jgi:hydrogenase maturation protease
MSFLTENHRQIVLGIGKYLKGDAAVGLIIVDQARLQLSAFFDDVVFKTNNSAGFDIIDDISGFKSAIIIDGVITGKKPPGFCFEQLMTETPEPEREQLIDSFGMNFSTMAFIGKQCGYQMPEHIIYLGIETANVSNFSRALTAPIKKIVNTIIEKIRCYLLVYNNPLQSMKIAPNLQSSCI